MTPAFHTHIKASMTIYSHTLTVNVNELYINKTELNLWVCYLNSLIQVLSEMLLMVVGFQIS